jgi:pyrroloquinoline quinone biosynthesis protein D
VECKRPRLAPHVVLRFDKRRNEHQLVGPEVLVRLDETASAILGLCDGRPLDEVCRELTVKYADCDRGEVERFLQELCRRKWVCDADA